MEGPSIKDILLEFGLNGIVEEKMDDIALQIGDTIGKLHDGGVVHGDLTTSNMLWRSGSNQLVFNLRQLYSILLFLFYFKLFMLYFHRY